MIHVKIMTNEAEMSLELYAEGHAGCAPVGGDIICSAVSILCFSLEAYLLCEPRERFSVLDAERGDGYTRITATVKDSQDYALVAEAITPARLALSRLTREFPRRLVFTDITQ
jgi:uncharacterized protein YsxB (DUF464 family)